MTTEQAQAIIEAAFPAADPDDIETYIYGPGDADDYFGKISDPEELKSDFRDFLK